jgi:hypothetical protein
MRSLRRNPRSFRAGRMSSRDTILAFNTRALAVEAVGFGVNEIAKCRMSGRHSLAWQCGLN